MQMINNKNGITLVSLIITIIIIVLITAISIEYGVNNVDEMANQKLASQLSIVQNAVLQRYSLLKAEGKLGVEAIGIANNAEIRGNSEKNRPKGLVGTRIADTDYIAEQGFSDVNLQIEYTSLTNGKKFEEYYYILSENDLNELGVKNNDEDEEVSYIVNYSTGEVFDLKNKEYHQIGNEDVDKIYIQPGNNTVEQKQYDFNDDN